MLLLLLLLAILYGSLGSHETKYLIWKSELMGYYLVFLDFLENSGEAALVSKDDQVPIDVDPSAKRTEVESMDDRLFIHYADDFSTIPLDTSAGGSEHPTADIDKISITSTATYNTTTANGSCTLNNSPAVQFGPFPTSVLHPSHKLTDLDSMFNAFTG
ncbi:hypothetical protein BGW80DRAFT_1248773 [Lactifluus volemus]|nr:hypothetical protein BGW80DRAFT_1248773 [Lactifluus volemus]